MDQPLEDDKVAIIEVPASTVKTRMFYARIMGELLERAGYSRH